MKLPPARPRARLISLSLVVILLLAMFGPIPAGAESTWNVQVGSTTPDYTSINSYLPGTIRIHSGDTVTWALGFDPDAGPGHTVTFLGGTPRPASIVPVPGEPGSLMIDLSPEQPTEVPAVYNGTGLVSSGVLGDTGPDTFSLTFGPPGTYQYVCLIHALQVGTVIVEPAGTPLPSREQVVAQGQAELAAQITAARQLAVTTFPVGQTRANGTRVWTAAVGAGTVHAGVNQFLPAELAIAVGDTVRWIYQYPGAEDPHTVTFLGGEDPPEFVDVRPQPAGPPLIVLGPASYPSVPLDPNGVPYNGTGLLNSGLLVRDSTAYGPAANFPDQFAATFTRPGSYSYVCLIHPWMVGTVDVRERGEWPPVTIDANASTDGQTASFGFMIRNLGTTDIRGVNINIPVPAGATVLATGIGGEGTLPGRNIGTEVQWSNPTIVIRPGETFGPFIVTVSVPEGTAPHELTTHAWMSFGGATPGTAVSVTIAAALPPFEFGEEGGPPPGAEGGPPPPAPAAPPPAAPVAPAAPPVVGK